MLQDNPLLSQLKKQITENLPRAEGTVRANDKGFGFLEVDTKTSYFIPPPFMKKCLHGDKVVALIRTENDKQQAEPEKLIEHNLTRFIARCRFVKGKLNVVADIPQMNKSPIRATLGKSVKDLSLDNGDWVVAELINHPLEGDKDHFMARVQQLVSKKEDKIAPWWVTLAQHDLPNSEPDSQAQWDMDNGGLTREDYTHIPFVTIDAKSTKDMDDALYAKALDNGHYQLMIAIADPTAYIQPNTEMDEIAKDRGFTIYMPGRNIPMLPRELADNLCSLVEGEQRAALLCKTIIDDQGNITQAIEFSLATIQSHARLDYHSVSDWLETPETADWQPNNETADTLNALHQISLLRQQWRQKHAVIFKDRVDYHFELDANNDVVAIHANKTRSANKLVEETMIVANLCAGQFLAEHVNTGVYNKHAGIKTDKLEYIADLMQESIGFSIDPDRLASVEGFSELRRKLSEQDTEYLDYRLRKHQTFTEFSTQPSEHFAMGLSNYATWTSPIRKYGDMINHRLIKSVLAEKSVETALEQTLVDHITLRKKQHRLVEKNIADWLYARTFNQDAYLTKTFQAEIFDINRSGMRAKLLDNGAVVFIPISLIHANKEEIAADAEQGVIKIADKERYKLSDIVAVTLEEVNVAHRSLIAKPI